MSSIYVTAAIILKGSNLMVLESVMMLRFYHVIPLHHYDVMMHQLCQALSTTGIKCLCKKAFSLF